MDKRLLKRKLLSYKLFKQLFSTHQRVKQARLTLNSIENEAMLITQQCLENRYRIKKTNGEKINIVFLCFRPSVWSSIETVYELMSNSENFNVKIVRMPRIDGNRIILEDTNGYFDKYGCIEAYDWEDKVWLDLRSLHPDYIFYQQPYNEIYPETYRSNFTSKYAKICYISYCNFLVEDDTSKKEYNNWFMRNVSYIFTQNEFDYSFINDILSKDKNHFSNIFITGYPRYEMISRNTQTGTCDKWNYKTHKGTFRILWTPRWRLDEGACNFFKYESYFEKYCQENNKIDFLFRPHPSAFDYWVSKKYMSPTKKEDLLRIYDKADNMRIDFSGEYFDIMNTSDCLVTDISGMILDYYCTGKPIIYCEGENYTIKGELANQILKGCYIVKTWKELQQKIVELSEGKDELKNTRALIAEKYLMQNGLASKEICYHILEDYGKSAERE